MRLALALTTAVLLAVPSGATRAAKTCHGQSCAHGGAGSGSGGSSGGGQQGGSPGQGHSPGGRGRAACDAARCTAQATIDENCACDAAANHGDYVKCVAHALEQMAVAGTVPRPCVGRIVRCASRSTCGKAGAVTCQVPASTCDSATGTCANDPSQGCSADSDCGTTCGIASSSDSCQTAGGFVGTSATCCSACTTTTTTTLPTTTTTVMAP